MQKYLNLIHSKGLPNVEPDQQVMLIYQEDSIQFNAKQIIPFERLKGISRGSESYTINGGPIRSAIGFGIVSLIVGGILGAIVTGDNASFGIITGIVGSIVGAIKGLQQVERNRDVLTIYYNSISNTESEIRLLSFQKTDKRTLIAMVKSINEKVGYTDSISQTKSVSTEPYEI